MISDNTVQRVKDLSIVDVLGKYVKLQRQGANYVCCRPFHDQNTPSLRVTPNENMMHCFRFDSRINAVKIVLVLPNHNSPAANTSIAKSNGRNVEH